MAKNGLKKYALPAIVIVAAVGGFMWYKKSKTQSAARARAMRAIMRMRANRAMRVGRY